MSFPADKCTFLQKNEVFEGHCSKQQEIAGGFQGSGFHKKIGWHLIFYFSHFLDCWVFLFCSWSTRCQRKATLWVPPNPIQNKKVHLNKSSEQLRWVLTHLRGKRPWRGLSWPQRGVFVFNGAENKVGQAPKRSRFPGCPLKGSNHERVPILGLLPSGHR